MLRTDSGMGAGDKVLIHRIHVHTCTTDYVHSSLTSQVRSKIKMCRMREGSWLGSGLEEQGLAGAGQHQLQTHAGPEVVRVS